MRGLEEAELRPMQPAEETVSTPEQNAVEEEGGWINSLLRRTKEWFEAEPDTEF